MERSNIEKARMVEKNLRQRAEEKARMVEEKRRWEAQAPQREEEARQKEEEARQIAIKEAHRMAEENALIARIKADIFSQLKPIIVEQLSVEENIVTLDSDMRDDLNADSLDAVELIMAIEEEFDIEIPDEAAEQITTVEKAVDCLYNRLSIQ